MGRTSLGVFFRMPRMFPGFNPPVGVTDAASIPLAHSADTRQSYVVFTLVFCCAGPSLCSFDGGLADVQSKLSVSPILGDSDNLCIAEPSLNAAHLNMNLNAI